MTQRVFNPFVAYLTLLLILILLSWQNGWPDLQDGRTIRDIQYLDTPGALAQVFVQLGLWISYFFCLRSEVWNWKRPVATALGLSFLASLSLPMNSGDFFSYIEFGRLILVYGLNPYQHGYREIQDFYSAYSWWGYPSNYAPLAFLFTFPAAAASELGAFWGFFVMKLTWWILGALSLWGAWSLVKHKPESQRQFAVFALCPVWLIEVMINGHNDVIFVLLVVLALLLLQHRRLNLSQVCLGLLPLFKLPLGVVSAFFFFFDLKKKRWLSALAGGATVIFGLLYLFWMLVDLGTASRFFAGSAPLSSQSFLGRNAWVPQAYFLGPEDKDWWALVAGNLSRLGMLSTLFALFWQIRRTKDDNQLANFSWLLWLMIFVFASQLWPWYSLWLLPFLLVNSDPRFFRFFFWGSVSTLVIYLPAYWQILIQGQTQRPPWWGAPLILFPTLVLIALIIADARLLSSSVEPLRGSRARQDRE